MTENRPKSRSGPPASELATLGRRQLDCADERYHTLLAAVQQKYHVDADPSGPSGFHEVSFAAYTDKSLEPVETVLDPKDTLPAYIEGLHKMFRSNVKTFEGGILYQIAVPQCWPFIAYYHSTARTTGRSDWDSMFATLQTTPTRKVVPCMFVSGPFGCHISDCPFYHASESEIAAARSVFLEKRRVYLTTPTPRSRFTFARNTCDTGDTLSLADGKANDGAVVAESKTLRAVCDNGLCAKTETDDGNSLLMCGGCGWARYCSAKCQKLCRKRHKLVCIKVDRLIEDDQLWTTEGDLKGQPTLHDEVLHGEIGQIA